MEIKNVIGDNPPEVFEILQVDTLINVQVDEDLELVRTKRSEARAFVRANR